MHFKSAASHRSARLPPKLLEPRPPPPITTHHPPPKYKRNRTRSMDALRKYLSSGRRDSLQSLQSPHDPCGSGINNNGDDYPLHRSHFRSLLRRHQSLLAPLCSSHCYIRKYLRSLLKSNEDSPPWASGLWTRLPVSVLAALVGVLLRMS